MTKTLDEEKRVTPSVSPIPTISAFAFVVAVYDYTDVDDLSPVMAKRHAVGFVPWGWDPDEQVWLRLSVLEGSEQEAREIALAHYMETMIDLDAAGQEFDPIEHEDEEEDDEEEEEEEEEE
jgi:hypothetical protein